MKNRLIMVTPDLSGLGGISRVVTIWRNGGFFERYGASFISTTSETSKNKSLAMFKALFCFFTVIRNGEIVYIHTAHYNSFYRKSFFILVACVFGKKIILHIHPSEFQDFYRRLSGIHRKYVSFILSRVHTFVVLTKEMRRYLLEMFPDKPVFVLTNAVNFQEMADTKGVRRGKDNLLYLGWYIRAKGIYELVDAVEIMVGKGISVHLNFYGTKEIDHLCEYVNNKNLTSYITVSGWIGEKEKLQALYESTLLVLPSHTEGIPNVILEAMATRTPLVATSVGGLKDILRDGENALIVEVNNPTDLSNKICRLLNDDELRRHLAENAYREAAEKYDVRVIKKQFFHIIEQGIG